VTTLAGTYLEASSGSPSTGMEAGPALAENQSVVLSENISTIWIGGVKRRITDVANFLQEQVAVALEPPLILVDKFTTVVAGNSGRSQARSIEAPTRRLEHYLRYLSRSGELSTDTALFAWRAWNQLRKATSYSLPVPDASPGPNGQLLYTWDRGEHHFELEIFPDGAGEFFYRNRASGRLWDTEYVVGQPVPQGVVDKLALFL
jgi:hypothetical protein